MKKLLFIRHAKSSWKDFSLADIERPLNKRGLRDAPFMGRKLKEQGIQPDLLVSSPAVRAYTTAQIIAKALDYPLRKIEKNPKIYEAGTRTIFKIIQGLDDKFKEVLIFGHNPTFTYMANYFSPTLIDNVPTCGIVAVAADIEHWKDFNQDTATFLFFDYPKRYL